MEIKIRTRKADYNYVNLFNTLIEKVDPEIKKMMEEFDFTFEIRNNYLETRTKDEAEGLKKIYKYDIDILNGVRGNLRDTKDSSGVTITIFHNTVTAEYIETILYHEIGHFLDFYFHLKNAAGKKSKRRKALSKSPEFVKAFKKDLNEHWDLIKNDNNYRLKHFIQDMSPKKKATDSVLCETFAELYRHNRGLKNDTKTVELYFPESKNVQMEIFKKLKWHFAFC